MKQAPIFLSFLVLTTICFAQGVPLGDQFQVNTYITGFQEDSDVARDDEGNFVVVWTNDHDPSPNWISGQRFLADGSPAGSEFQVNTLYAGFVDLPRVAMAGDGRFVVVWHDTGGDDSLDGDSYSVRGQRFQADGTPVGSEMAINSYTNGVQGWPSVAMRDDGSFVVVWVGEGTHDGNGVHAQAFGWDGLSLWGEYGINDHLPDDVHYPHVSTAESDRFVVVWASYGSPGNDASGQSIQARCYQWAPVVPAPQQQVNTTTGGNQYQSAVAVAPDGSFMVVFNLADNSVDIGGQSFNSNCVPVGGEFVINTTPDQAAWPDVAVDDQGRYIVNWVFGDIFGRIYSADGVAYGDEFTVPSHDFPVHRSRVAARPDGQFVASWTSYGSVGDDDSINCIQARRFAGLTGVFVDDFETGDISAWSDSLP